MPYIKTLPLIPILSERKVNHLSTSFVSYLKYYIILKKRIQVSQRGTYIYAYVNKSTENKCPLAFTPQEGILHRRGIPFNFS